MIDSNLFYNIFVIMSEALLSDNQVDLIRSVIAKDKKEQLARTKESYRKLKKDRVKEILSNPSGINDEKAKQNHKEAVKQILYENFEDGIVTASYDQRIIGLCEKQRKENSVEVRLSLSMLYRQDEMEEKLNDQERIRSEQKSKQMGESRKSLGMMQESRKEEMLMSPSPAKENIASRNEQSYPLSSAQAGEISHSKRDKSQSSDRVQQSSSSNIGKDFAVVDQNEPVSQQDASFNSSIMNSPTFLPYNHSQHRLRENSSKKENQFSYPQLSPPAIDSIEQNQTSQGGETYLPQPKIQEIFENLQVKTEAVPQSPLPEPMIEQLSRPENVDSSSAVCQTKIVDQVVKVEQQIVEYSPKDIAVQSSVLQPQNAEQRQHESRDNKADVSPAIQHEIQVVRIEAGQFSLISGKVTEDISVNEFPNQRIKLIYDIAQESAEVVLVSAQITDIEGQENKHSKDNYEIIQ